MNFNNMKKDELVDIAIRRFLYNDVLPPLNSDEYDELISKVDSDNLKDDLIDKLEKSDTRGFEVVEKEYRQYPDNKIKKPKHGSQFSAGYDFFLAQSITLPRGKSIIVSSDIRAYMPNDEVLNLYVRSSTGIKKHVVLTNQVGIIDSDYYDNAETGGNIGLALTNTGDSTQHLKGRVVQGIFNKYLQADNYDTKSKRVGGLGSSGGHNE